MAKQPSKNLNVSVAGVYIEDELNSASLDIKQEVIEVTAFADAGPRRVVGNYDYSMSLEGSADFAAAQGDATLFSLVGKATASATAFEPTGAVVGASDPHYDSTDMVLESYSIKASIGAAVTYSASLQGAAALARAVA
jgi:hypothetical protein